MCTTVRWRLNVGPSILNAGFGILQFFMADAWLGGLDVSVTAFRDASGDKRLDSSRSDSVVSVSTAASDDRGAWYFRDKLSGSISGRDQRRMVLWGIRDLVSHAVLTAPDNGSYVQHLLACSSLDRHMLSWVGCLPSSRLGHRQKKPKTVA